MLSTTEDGCRRANGPTGYPELPGKRMIPAKECEWVWLPIETRGEDGLIEREGLDNNSRIGSKSGCVSYAGLGTVDVRSIHRGRKSGFASCCTSESSSVDETVT